jgi:hypothetical protein
MKTHELFIPPQSDRWNAIHWGIYIMLLAIGFGALHIVARYFGGFVSLTILGH